MDKLKDFRIVYTFFIDLFRFLHNNKIIVCKVLEEMSGERRCLAM